MIQSLIVNGVDGGAVEDTICYWKRCWRWRCRYYDLLLEMVLRLAL
jgi:hypothetical protein